MKGDNMNIQTLLNINLGDEELFCEHGSENCSSFLLSEEVMRTLRYQIASELAQKVSKPQIDTLKKEIEEAADIEALNALKEEMSKSFDTILVSGNHGQVTLKKRVEEKMISFLTDKNISAILTKIAEDTLASLKEKYDMFYAMQLLKKMSQAGMLKDDSIVRDFDTNGSVKS